MRARRRESAAQTALNGKQILRKRFRGPQRQVCGFDVIKRSDYLIG